MSAVQRKPESRATVHPFRGQGTPPLPSLREVVEVVAETTSDHHADLVVVCGEAGGSLDVGIWPIPADVPHPTDVLVGWRPPAWAHAVGLVSLGEARSAHSVEPVRITVAAAADGRTAAVLQRQGRPMEAIEEPPLGWGADALNRCLGRPTPPPQQPLHTCVEAAWLGEVRRLVREAAGHGTRPTWDQVALAHPLHPPGWPAPPHQLRAATAALDAGPSWDRVVELVSSGRPRTGAHPPGGRRVSLTEWFDAGSFARWTMRHLPDPDDLLFEVLHELPEHVGSALVDSLLSTTGWEP